LASSVTPLLASHSVAGLAPMKQNSPEQAVLCSSPVAMFASVTCSRRSSPARPWTSTPVSSAIFGSASIR